MPVEKKQKYYKSNGNIFNVDGTALLTSKVTLAYLQKQLPVNVFSNTQVEDMVSQVLSEQDKETSRPPSGRLSASRLFNPVQWNVLDALGTMRQPIDPYTLRKFARGKEVEDWLLKTIKDNVKEAQIPVDYKGIVGYIDAIIPTLLPTTAPSTPLRDMVDTVHEIKSVTNAKFKRISERGSPDEGHEMQAALYAIARNEEWFVIDYIASDDLRVLSFTCKVTDHHRKFIEQAQLEYMAAIATRTVPAFEAREKWQENKQYNPYFQFKDTPSKILTEYINEQYQNAWNDLYLRLKLN